MGHLSGNCIHTPTRKAFLRFWALLLSLVTVFSLVPAGVAAETPKLQIAVDGVKLDDIYMTTRERVVLEAHGAEEGSAYQWQILHPESDSSWISIYDGIRQELSVTMALAKNMLRPDGTVQLRCRATAGDSVIYSDPVTVHITEPQPAQTVAVSSEPATQDTLSGAEGDGEIPEFVTVTIEYIRYDYARDDNGDLLVDSEGNFILEVTGQAFLPYVATLQGGNPLKDTEVTNPTMVGYSPYYNGAPSSSILLNFDSVVKDEHFTVEYRPSLVDYSVRYFLQNVYDDLYVEDAGMYVDTKGHTGTTPPREILSKEKEGFTALYYQPDFIAADGSTVFEVYYERDYYLMEFDCDGGYGTETLYIRYGSYISIPQPVKPGWSFVGWDRTYYTETVTNAAGEKVENRINVADGVKDDLPTTLPAYNSGYKAIWTTTNTTYTVVYWAENANDNNYSYWGYQTFNAKSAEIRSGVAYGSNTDTVARDADGNLMQDVTRMVNETKYFTINNDKTNKNVVILGDGSSIINVYYTRNVYTVSFRTGGKCAMTAHTHITDVTAENSCYAYICGEAEHTHTAECLDCDIEEHTHNASCCTRTEHTHSEICCSLTSHSHGTGCCSLAEHAHSISCYQGVGDAFSRSYEEHWVEGTETNGSIGESYYTYFLGSAGTGKKYIYINGTWYRYTGSTAIGGTAPLTCGKQEHTHGTGCNSGKCTVGYEHTHNTGSCNGSNCPVGYTHTHGDGSCVCKDNKPEHTHVEDCYDCTYEITHTHTDECVGLVCKMTEHTHTNSCKNTNSKIVYSITGKYGMDIREHFAIVSKEDSTIDYTGYWWQVPKGSTFFEPDTYIVSIDSIPGENIVFSGSYNGVDAKIYYYLETLNNETGPADKGYEEYNNEYYKLYKTVITRAGGYLTDKEEFHEIPGFTKGSYRPNGIFSSGYGNGVKPENWLYYTRNKYNLRYYNYNSYHGDTKTFEYQASLTSYEISKADMEANYYPSKLEPGAYEFGGWYTTAGCYPGTEVNWSQLTMPNSDLTLYAKWTPILRNVTFYKTYDDMKDKATPFLEAKDVPHGELLGSAYNQQPTAQEGYRFIGWFYMDDENKKRFAPDSMEITRDLELFAEWTTTIDTTYDVTYVLKDDVTMPDPTDPGKTVTYPAGTVIADEEFNHITVGKTKTFQAKGGTHLYPAFRQSIFPTTNSHSILMKESGSENTFEFQYVYDSEVWYKVQYLDYQTRTPLASAKVDHTNKAIITEKFLPIKGYRPTGFYVTQALASDGEGDGSSIPEENVLTFLYIKDEDHGMFSIEHYLENPNSTDSSNRDNYTLYESEVGSSDVNKTITGHPRTYTGFSHNAALNYTIWYEITSNGSNPDTVTEKTGNVLFGPVTYAGLTIKIYYSRQNYPYIIEYREHGVDEKTDPLKRLNVNGADVGKTDPLPTQKYDSELTHTAEESFTLDGINYEYYIPDSTEADRTKTTDIRVATNDSPNKLIFYYTKKKIPVHYHAVCTEEVESDVKFGAVSIASESAASAKALGGSTPMPASGFVFKGWFQDEACTIPVDETWVDTTKGSLLKPEAFTLEEGLDEDHYYALFAPVTRDLKIVKDGVSDTADSFLFSITGTNALGQKVNLTVSIQGSGEVTVKGLYCGTYTVTELTGWSWNYACAVPSQEVTLTVEETGVKTVTFTNTYQQPDWLTDEARAENQFS